MALPAVAAAARTALQGAGKTAQHKGKDSSSTPSASPEALIDQAKAKGITVLWGSLLGAIGMFNVFIGAGVVFLLWVNFIGWNLLPIARPMLSKPGNEMLFFPPEWRGLLHTVALVVLTGVYLLEVIMFLSIIVILFAVIAELQKFLPPVIRDLFL